MERFGLGAGDRGLVALYLASRLRKVFEQVLKLHDGQIRFYGIASIAAGLLLLWIAS
jgi:uncharacterized protein